MEEEDEDEARINIPLQTLPSSQPWEPAHHSDSEESFMDSESVEDGPITGMQVQDEERGCLSKMCGCDFFTRSNLTDREVVLKANLKELIVYIFFLITLSVVIYGMVSPYQYYYTKSMENIFIDGPGLDDPWVDVDGQASFWKYAETTFLSGVFDYDETNSLYVYGENKLLSLPRIRQLRVSNKSCEVPLVFSNSISKCFNIYTKSDEDVNDIDFTSYWTDESNGSQNYLKADQLDTLSYRGELALYSGSGYTQLLNQDKNISNYILNDLKDNNWIDQSTRVVFIDYTLYNANINMFCAVKLVCEFLPTGGIITSNSIQVQKLLRYVTTKDSVIFGFEIALIVFVIYYTVEELIELSKLRIKYFSDGWNVLDCIILIQALIGMGLSFYRSITINSIISEAEAKPDQYVSFEVISYYESIYVDLAAVVLFFSWIKIFKYINFNKTMTHLTKTLSECFKDLMSFAIMFFIIFFAFTQLGFLLFGTILKDFSSFLDSTYTLFRIILGDFDFHALEAANRILGPIFFIVYVFSVFFILLNMFLAIINDTYSGVKARQKEDPDELQFLGYIKSLFGFKPKAARVTANPAILPGPRGKDAVSEKVMQRRAPPSEVFDDSDDSLFEEDSQPINNAKLRAPRTQETMASFLNAPWDSQSNMGPDHLGIRGPGGKFYPSYEEFKILSRRVDRNDDAMGSVISKVDAVLSKLEMLEKSYHKGVFPAIEEPDLPFPDCIENEQTIHIPDETGEDRNEDRNWTDR